MGKNQERKSIIIILVLSSFQLELEILKEGCFVNFVVSVVDYWERQCYFNFLCLEFNFFVEFFLFFNL